ncbi:hypothetical protein AVEN_54848-1 [Araneus ventricosus]|uniref:Uncharacterized protein n=1 Tax=Araneus ventricosus TaxID=182803 RepID=A0A4Y2BG71_ARAVE|nr:hypothetical protein AVEN_54848-1 [Araneus ventricosus]
MFRFSSAAVSLNKNGFVDILESNPIVVWNKKVPDTELDKFKKIVEKKYGQHFSRFLIGKSTYCNGSHDTTFGKFLQIFTDHDP